MRDQQIVDLYWERNEEAIQQPERKYGAYLSKVAYNILADFEDSQECVNDTYHLTVTDKGGRKFRIDKIRLSPIGIHMDSTLLTPVRGDSALDDFDVSIQLYDGTELELPGVLGINSSQEGKTADVDYEAMFDRPIPIEDISALIICDTTYPINGSD